MKCRISVTLLYIRVIFIIYDARNDEFIIFFLHELR
jgi:hypothetical protein